MSRRIVTQQLQDAGPAGQIDTYFDRVIKYIPADVVAAWTLVSSLIGEPPKIPAVAHWGLFVVFIALTALWTYRQTTVKNQPVATVQIIISSVAFAVWVFALKGPFARFEWYNELYGSILLIVFTLVVPLITPDTKPAPVSTPTP